MVCHIPMPACAHRCCGHFSTAKAERKTMGRLLAGIAAVAMGLFATPGLAQEKLTIWGEKGFYTAEGDAMLAVVERYAAKTVVKVELNWFAAREMSPKVTVALDAGTPPDIAYAEAFNLQATGRWAF